MMIHGPPYLTKTGSLFYYLMDPLRRLPESSLKSCSEFHLFSGFRDNLILFANLNPLQLLLIDPEFLDYFAPDSLIFTSHLCVVFKNKMTV